jgi:hypothetical protein
MIKNLSCHHNLFVPFVFFNCNMYKPCEVRQEATLVSSCRVVSSSCGLISERMNQSYLYLVNSNCHVSLIIGDMKNDDIDAPVIWKRLQT